MNGIEILIAKVVVEFRIWEKGKMTWFFSFNNTENTENVCTMKETESDKSAKDGNRRRSGQVFEWHEVGYESKPWVFERVWCVWCRIHQYVKYFVWNFSILNHFELLLNSKILVGPSNKKIEGVLLLWTQDNVKTKAKESF